MTLFASSVAFFAAAAQIVAPAYVSDVSWNQNPDTHVVAVSYRLSEGAIVTAENHNVINGLGSAVADVLATRKYAPLEKVGVQDQFGQVGPLKFLMEYYHLTAADIVAAAKRAIARK